MSKAALARLLTVVCLVGIGLAAFGTGTARAECGEEEGTDIAFQRSGKLLVALCGPRQQAAVLRLDRAGLLDASFAGDGSLGPWPSNFPPHLAVTAQGKLLVQMSLGKGKRRRVVLRRFSAAGKLDRSFASGNASVPTEESSPREIHVFSQPQGTTVVAYYGEFDGCFGGDCAERTNYLQRYRYSATGKRITEANYYTEYWGLSNITMAPDGDLLVAGGNLEYGTITYLRTKPDLKPLAARKVPEEFASGRSEILAGPGRSLLISGVKGGIGLYRADWSLDEAFGEAGFVRCGPAGAILTPVTSLPSGGFLAKGNSAECGLMLYEADGRLDPTFGSGGSVDLEALGLLPSRYRMESVAVGPAGQIAIAFGDQDKPIVRIFCFSADGQLETGFGSDGVVAVRNFTPA